MFLGAQICNLNPNYTNTMVAILFFCTLLFVMRAKWRLQGNSDASNRAYLAYKSSALMRRERIEAVFLSVLLVCCILFVFPSIKVVLGAERANMAIFFVGIFINIVFLLVYLKRVIDRELRIGIGIICLISIGVSFFSIECLSPTYSFFQIFPVFSILFYFVIWHVEQFTRYISEYPKADS